MSSPRALAVTGRTRGEPGQAFAAAGLRPVPLPVLEADPGELEPPRAGAPGGLAYVIHTSPPLSGQLKNQEPKDRLMGHELPGRTGGTVPLYRLPGAAAPCAPRCPSLSGVLAVKLGKLLVQHLAQDLRDAPALAVALL